MADITVSEYVKLVDLTSGATKKTSKEAIQGKLKTDKNTIAEIKKALDSAPLKNPSDEEDKAKFVSEVFRDELYETQFAFAGKISILGSDPFTIQKNPTIPSRIEFLEGDKITIKVADVARKFGLKEDTVKHLAASDITVSDFMLDTKTKEYSVGVKATNPLGFLDAVGAGFVRDVIDIKSVSIYLSKTEKEDVKAIGEADTDDDG